MHKLIILLLLVIASRSTAAVAIQYNAIFKAQTGWDIYTGGVYRYGPSIIENSDGSIDAWFAAPGGQFGEMILYYNDTGIPYPVGLSTENTAAQKFIAVNPFYAINVFCPAPIDKVYANYTDNQYTQLARDDKFTSGEYLWLLSNSSGTAGVWKIKGDVSNVTNYLNDQVVTDSYHAFAFINATKGGSYWDQVAYRRSVDGGETWTPDQMVLKPTEDTRDQFSVCDPGLVKSGSYYYIGYTSTEDPRGMFNHAYVARSTSPAGPWDKWNGNSWGGSPQPIITFTGDRNAWGAGEPSIVVRDGTIFFYHSWNGLQTTETHLATGDANDENWPAHLSYHGLAINKTAIVGADHCDVKYRNDLQKFYAIHAASRLTQNSYVVLWESSDGLSFTKIAEIRDNLKPYLHNCGWSGDENGHINPVKQQYLSYAYGPHWANWNTAWHPITFQ
ncbi:unnamed protein product [Adineta steineri]|uniref:Uncharacterized protein n=1 Tax=Adineta steineri TaxID=433720 RepID=A0A815KXJ7_9BILA|nr:unnamed protein product [Adineta steineri]